MEQNLKISERHCKDKRRAMNRRLTAIAIGVCGLAISSFCPLYGMNNDGGEENVLSAVEENRSEILQVAGQTPIASKNGIDIGKAKKGSSQNKGLVDELEEIPNIDVRADTDASTGHKPHGAMFMEVMPGVTKFSELDKNPTLGKPVAIEKVDGYDVATFQTATLPDVTIQVVGVDGLVEAVMINLKDPRSESDARKVFESEIKDVRPIWTPDEMGNFREVFPEKGVAFVLEKGERPGLPSNRVVQIVAETVKCEYFIMRAEQDLASNLTYARDDAEHALLHDPNAPGANWILAKTHLAVGDFSNARRHIYKAIKLNDTMPQFHLTYIDTLIQAGEVASALRYMDAVRDSFVEHPLFAIEAVCLDSNLKRESAEPDYDGAISQGQRALNLLQTLYTAKPTAEVYLSAKQLELRANLSIATAVAQKQWKNPSDQDKAFEWLDAASEVAKEIDSIRPEESQLPSAQLDVLETAITVGLEMPDSERIDSYVQKLKASAELYLRKTLDEVSAASVRWNVGRALVAASRIYEARKEMKVATECCKQGLDFLQIVTEYRELPERVPTAIAQLQLGLLLAGSDRLDEAFEYWDTACEYVGQIKKDVKGRDSVRIGAPLASVASIYWKNRKKEKGFDILKNAAFYLEKAHEQGFVKNSNLYVVYSNLSTMSKGLKKTEDSAKYKKLADQYKAGE